MKRKVMTSSTNGAVIVIRKSGHPVNPFSFEESTFTSTSDQFQRLTSLVSKYTYLSWVT